MILNILSDNDLKTIRGHFMGGKKLKLEREYSPCGYRLTVTVREASGETWGQKMLIRTESEIGCNYRSQYHTNIDSLKRFIAEDDSFLESIRPRKGGVSSV